MKWLRPDLWAVASVALTSLAISQRPAVANGGKYDAASKSFSLNYIYLDLPGVISQDQVNLSIDRTRPSSDQSRTVDRFWKIVSDKLSVVTSGRAKIGQLTEVQDVNKADVVISLTGSILPAGAGGAWAGQHGFQQGGTINLYYQDLAQEDAENIANTVVHELCHYFFGLPDEYPPSPSTQRLCPPVAPGLERCLMDNFHIGFLGRFCQDSEHNPSAPGANGYAPVEPAGDSCEKIVNAFFEKLGVKPDGGAAPGSTPSSKPKPKPTTLTSAQADSVLKIARAFLASIKAKRKGGAITAQDRRNLRDRIIQGLVDTLKSQAKNIDIAQVAEDLVGKLILTPLGVPPGLQVIEKALIARAVELARGLIGQDGGPDDIELKLLDFARAQLTSVGASPALGEDDVNYIRDLAKQTASGSLPNQPETIDQLRDELIIEIARTLNSGANEFNLPGAVDRGNSLARIVGELQQQGKIPNRSLGSRFGRRRTVLIEPPIMVKEGIQFPDDGIDYVQTQGEKKSHYNGLRLRDTDLFSKLIDRNRINLLSGISTPSSNADGAGMDDVKVGIVDLKSSNYKAVFDIDSKAGDDDIQFKDGPNKGKVDKDLIQDVLDRRKRRTLDLLSVVKDYIERDLIENIVVVVPPGGLPGEFADPIASLGEQFVGKADLRIDIALVGSAKIPPELRDLVVRSKGSILTLTDSDEIGSIAQRLAGEQTQGTWIAIPQQDMLVVGEKPNFDAFPPGQPRPLYARLRGIRASHKLSTAANDSPKVVLRPFYVDDSNDYELIVGLTQPLTIAGLSSISNPNGPRSPLGRSGANQGLFPDPKMLFLSGEIRDPEQVAKLEATPLGGIAFAPTREVVFDRSKSTENALVFRLPSSKAGTGTGWVTPVLSLAPGNFKDAVLVDKDGAKVVQPADHKYNEGVIHFTFSVGTPTSKAQLVANLVQEGPNGGPVLQQGTIGSDKVEVIITASLTAGAAVVDAEVIGFYQKIDESSEDIITKEILPKDFRDDGKAPDKSANDGVYTTSIPLDPRRSRSAEYRVFIEGRSVEGKTKFVPAGEIMPMPGADQGDLAAASKKILERPAPVFQRATSLHFSVPANSD